MTLSEKLRSLKSVREVTDPEEIADHIKSRKVRGCRVIQRNGKNILEKRVPTGTISKGVPRPTVEDAKTMASSVGLPWDDACLQFHKAKRHEKTLSYDQVNKPIYKTSVGRAERYGALLDPLREALESEPG